MSGFTDNIQQFRITFIVTKTDPIADEQNATNAALGNVSSTVRFCAGISLS